MSLTRRRIRAENRNDLHYQLLVKAPLGSSEFTEMLEQFHISFAEATRLQIDGPTDDQYPVEENISSDESIRNRLPPGFYHVLVFLPNHFFPPNKNYYVLKVVMTELEMTSLPDYIAAVQRQLNYIWLTDAPVGSLVPKFDQGRDMPFQYMSTVRSYFLRKLISDDHVFRQIHSTFQEESSSAAAPLADVASKQCYMCESPCNKKCRCKNIRYCCHGCQLEDWPRHKLTCAYVCAAPECTKLSKYKCPCRSARYCSTTCQLADWLNHKLDCPLVWN